MLTRLKPLSQCWLLEYTCQEQEATQAAPSQLTSASAALVPLVSSSPDRSPGHGFSVLAFERAWSGDVV